MRDGDRAVRIDSPDAKVGELGTRLERIEARHRSGREARPRIVVRALSVGDRGVGRLGCGHGREVVDVRLRNARDQSAAGFAFGGRRFRVPCVGLAGARGPFAVVEKSVARGYERQVGRVGTERQWAERR